MTSRETTLRERVYLDNAATSWPKPEAVYAAVDRYQRELGAPFGRGTYDEAVEVEQIVARARRAAAQLLGSDDPRRIVFTNNCTSALNLAIHGLLRAGDHVVTTVIEHNSVLRPLRHLEEAGVIVVTRVGCDAEGIVDPDEVRRSMRPNTRLVAVAHASNVTGAIQPIVEIGRIARETGARFLVDAAQTAGHVPIDVEACHVDLWATSGHKGLLGPLGTGMLWVGVGIEDQLEAVQQGGTGTDSEFDLQPLSLPDKFEAGNLNALGIVGLEAGLRYLATQGLASIAEHSRRLTAVLWDGLRQIDGVKLFGPSDIRQRVGVISLAMDGYNPQELAAMLDAAYGIQGRAGLHCAPRMHQALRTLSMGGTFRLSIGPFNTQAQVDRVIQAIAAAAGAEVV